MNNLDFSFTLQALISLKSCSGCSAGKLNCNSYFVSFLFLSGFYFIRFLLYILLSGSDWCLERFKASMIQSRFSV